MAAPTEALIALLKTVDTATVSNAVELLHTGVPVQVTGVTIRTGDLLHADENGQISISESGRDRLTGLIDEIGFNERALPEFVRGSGFTAAQLRRRFFH